MTRREFARRFRALASRHRRGYIVRSTFRRHLDHLVAQALAAGFTAARLRNALRRRRRATLSG